MAENYNILLVGVGGQGTILAAKVLAAAALAQKLEVKMSEIHGMAQRGGSVITHVRVGEKVYSPLVEPGEADVIVAFEELEALRYQVPRLQQAVNKVEEVKKERQVLEARAGELEALIQGRRTWSSLLADLSAVMPDGAWLNALRLVPRQAVSPAAKTERAGTVPSLLQGALQGSARAMEAESLQQPAAAQQGSVPAAPQQAGAAKALPPPEGLQLEGASRSLAAVGVLLYHLRQLPYFSGVELNEVKYDEGKGFYTFSITAHLRGDGG